MSCFGSLALRLESQPILILFYFFIVCVKIHSPRRMYEHNGTPALTRRQTNSLCGRLCSSALTLETCLRIVKVKNGNASHKKHFAFVNSCLYTVLCKRFT